MASCRWTPLHPGMCHQSSYRFPGSGFEYTGHAPPKLHLGHQLERGRRFLSIESTIVGSTDIVAARSMKGRAVSSCSSQIPDATTLRPVVRNSSSLRRPSEGAPLFAQGTTYPLACMAADAPVGSLFVRPRDSPASPPARSVAPAHTPEPRDPRQQAITVARESGQFLLRQRPRSPPGAAYAALPALTGAPEISPFASRPCSESGLTACPATPKPQPGATHSRPEMRASRPRALWTESQCRPERPGISASFRA